MHKKLELWMSWITVALITVFLGGFSLITNQLTESQYKETFLPIFKETVEGLSVEEGMTLFKTLGSWFTFTVITVLILTFVASLFLTNKRYLLGASICYFLAGLVTLIGSQLIAFVLAFPLFVTAGFCFYDFIKEKKEKERKTNGTN
ncbi:MAG TPA: DUF4064 domain-containing protein [Candidatus Tetragenococcus pullicola]|nr:DUF4064 domain-containing protein [Candidatus Tetragenococcus pullicola]